jgi:hypothetical protein
LFQIPVKKKGNPMADRADGRNQADVDRRVQELKAWRTKYEQGRAVVTVESDGEAVMLTLPELLDGGTDLQLEDGTRIRLKRVTLNTLAKLQAQFPEGIETDGDDLDAFKQLCAILYNQDLPEDQHKTAEQIGDIIPADAIPALMGLLQEVLSPLSEGLEGQQVTGTTQS